MADRLVGARNPVRTCRGCGCDDNHACVTKNGACAWVLLDLFAPTGVCSACAVEVGWDPRAFLLMGRAPEELGLGDAPRGLMLP